MVFFHLKVAKSFTTIYTILQCVIMFYCQLIHIHRGRWQFDLLQTLLFVTQSSESHVRSYRATRDRGATWLFHAALRLFTLSALLPVSPPSFESAFSVARSLSGPTQMAVRCVAVV